MLVLSVSQPRYLNLTTNQSVTLSVEFVAHLSHNNLSVRWFKNEVALQDNDTRIHTTFHNILNRVMNTRLMLPSISDNDTGIYTVIISSQVGLTKGGTLVFTSRQEVSFQINGKLYRNALALCL